MKPSSFARLSRYRACIATRGTSELPVLEMLSSNSKDQSESVMSLLRTTWRSAREQNGAFDGHLRPSRICQCRSCYVYLALSSMCSSRRSELSCAHASQALLLGFNENSEKIQNRGLLRPQLVAKLRRAEEDAVSGAAKAAKQTSSGM